VAVVEAAEHSREGRLELVKYTVYLLDQQSAS